MKVQYLFISFLLVFNLSLAQETNENEVKNNDFNRWSVEFNLGQSKGVRPFTDNYYSSNPKDYFNFSKVNHYDLGFRYMFNEYFGAKLDFSYDLFQNESGSGSLPFEAKMYGVGLQGVINIGRVLHFNSFTKRFGLLAHAGVKVSQFTPQTGIHKGITEDNGGVVFGLTPQFRLSNRFCLTGDFSVLSNMRQHYNWDGISISNDDNNLTGLMNTVSFGITYYIGKKSDVHADWYDNLLVQKDKDKVDVDARKRLDEIEALLSDADKDGVADYLDFENNTPGGVAVDTRGRFIDLNNNSIPDELESRDKNTNSQITNNNNSIISDVDVMKTLVERGYLNVFFKVNEVVPDDSSTSVLYTLLKFLKLNENVKISLKGFADVSGGNEFNEKLSENRAKFVHDFLVKNGVDISRISFSGKGVENAIITGNDELDYRFARRVSVFIE